MIKFILLFIISFSIFAQDEIIFVDINNQPQEIEAAKLGAQKLGKKLIVFPNEQLSTEDKSLSYENLEKFLSDKKFDSLILSGHDGGGNYSGTNGTLSRDDVIHLISNHPYAGDNLNQLMLLGCFTGVRSEMNLWKGGLPNLKLISGYEGAAPLGHRRSGHTFIEDMLDKSDEIISQTSYLELEDILKNQIRNMDQLSAAIYVEAPACMSVNNKVGSELYYRPQNDNEMSLFRDSECKKMADKFFGEVYPKYQKYFQGEIPIPTSIAGTELREIYHFIMKNIDCIDDAIKETNSALMLLFFHEFKKNAALYYQDLFSEVDQMIHKISEKTPRQHFQDNLAEVENDIQILEADLVNSANIRSQAESAINELHLEIQKLQLTEIEKNLIVRSINGENVDFSSFPPSRTNIYAKAFSLYYDKIKIEKAIRPENLNAKINAKLETLKDNKKYYENLLRNSDAVIDHVYAPKFQEIKEFKILTPANIATMSRKEVVEEANKIQNYIAFIFSRKDQDKFYLYQDVVSSVLYHMENVPQSWFEEAHDINAEHPSRYSKNYISRNLKMRSSIQIEALLTN